jgi:hypothetical protein
MTTPSKFEGDGLVSTSQFEEVLRDTMGKDPEGWTGGQEFVDLFFKRLRQDPYIYPSGILLALDLCLYDCKVKVDGLTGGPLSGACVGLDPREYKTLRGSLLAIIYKAPLPPEFFANLTASN